MLRLHLSEKLINLNIFKDSESNIEHNLQTQILATRLFILLLTTSLLVFISYVSLVSVTKTITVDNLQIDHYLKLQEKYSETLVCPCTSISNEYKEFVSFSPTFHPVCQSDLLQTDWLTSQVAALQSINYNTIQIDFSRFARNFFTLKSLCQLSVQTINNSLLVFYSTRLVTENLLSLALFQLQVNGSITLFQETTQTSFGRSLTMIRHTTQGNQLHSVLQTSSYILWIADYLSNELIYQGAFYDPNDLGEFCYCEYNTVSCSELLPFSSNYPHFIGNIKVPNIYMSCYIVEETLISNLDCFFNQSCFSVIIDFISNLTAAAITENQRSYNLNAMNYSSTSRYQTNTSIKDIVDQLFLEHWNSLISFENYFQLCKPAKCVYTYKEERNLIYMITATIGFLGGLATILQIVLVPIVSFIRRPTFSVQSLTKFLKTLNFFVDIAKTTDYDLRNQYVATRLFILIQLISVSILVLYTSLSNLTQTVRVSQPTPSLFSQLSASYPQTLNCPCANFSLNYGTFISFNPTYHQLCQSSLITLEWIKTFGYSEDTGASEYTGVGTNYFYRTLIDDYRTTGGVAFQFLANLCQLASESVNAGLLTFNSTKFLTTKLISLSQFEMETSLFIQTLKTHTVNSFNRFFVLIRNLTQANQLLSSKMTNAIVNLDIPYDPYAYDGNYTDDEMMVAANGRLSYTYPDRTYFQNKTCYCTQSQFCIQEAKIYDLTVTEVLVPVRSKCALNN